MPDTRYKQELTDNHFMIELVFQVILFSSIAGLAFLILRKIPVLVSLPVEEAGEKEPFSWRGFLKETVKQKDKAAFVKRMLVERGMAKLKKLKRNKKRSKTGEREVNFSDDYWEKIRRG